MSKETLEANIKAANSSRAQLQQAGLLDGETAGKTVSTRLSKLRFGFSRKNLPPDIPIEPRMFIYSVSGYGEAVNLGAGFGEVWEVRPCPEGAQHGPACEIKPIYFFEEVIVDKTEHTPYTDVQIADCLMRVGAGLAPMLNRSRVGWFISRSNPPKQEEVETALLLYTAECKRLLEEGNQKARSGRPDDMKDINEEHRRAAAFLKQTVTWDQPASKMINCPRCGEPVKEGALVHAVPYCGHVFQLLPYWVSMVQSGQKMIIDAPESIQEQLIKELKKKQQ